MSWFTIKLQGVNIKATNIKPVKVNIKENLHDVRARDFSGRPQNSNNDILSR